MSEFQSLPSDLVRTFMRFSSILRGNLPPDLNSPNAFGVMRTMESYPFASAAHLSLAKQLADRIVFDRS